MITITILGIVGDLAGLQIIYYICALLVQTDLNECTLYSSLEPCGERLSGKKTCVERISETGIKKVVFGAYEPDKFVKGKGAKLLKQAGLEAVYLETKDAVTVQ